MRKTMLDQAINGRKVICYVDGLVSLKKNSNLYRAMKAHGYTLDDLWVKFDIAVGGLILLSADDAVSTGGTAIIWPS